MLYYQRHSATSYNAGVIYNIFKLSSFIKRNNEGPNTKFFMNLIVIIIKRPAAENKTFC